MAKKNVKPASLDSIKNWVEVITKKRAEELLANLHDRQRHMTLATVEKYIAEMKAGKWTMSPHGIVINKDGKLIDGQHRMEAVRRSGISLPFMVFQVEDDSVMWAIDRGKTRDMANLIEMSGDAEKGQGIYIASVARAIHMFQEGIVASLKFSSIIDKVLENNKDDMLTVINIYGKKNRTPVSVFAAFVYAYQAYPEQVSKIMTSVSNNDGLEKHTGPWHIRRMIDEKGREKYGYLLLAHHILRSIQMEILGERRERVMVRFNPRKPTPFLDNGHVNFFVNNRIKNGYGPKFY